MNQSLGFLRPGGRRLLAGFLIALFAGVAPLHAQVADAVLEVNAVDETGQSLPGATVTVRRPDTGFERSLVTGDAGGVRVGALAPGSYEVKVELTGFTPVVQQGLVLRVGQTARLDVTLKVATVQETVTVTADLPLVDVYKTDSSTNILPEQIQDLPVADRDFQRLAFLAPGVQRERGGFRFIGGGPVIGAGGNASQSTILVDGADFTDTTLGLARARFSQDAIGEFRVIANRFDTEVGGSAGGALSIVTKSGTNQVKGSAFGFFRDDSLRAKGEYEAQKNDYQRSQFGFTLGGPLQKDKTHFFVSLEQIDEDSITLFRPGGAYASLAADVPLPLSQTLGFAGLDHRISTTQSLKAKFAYERYRLENFRVGGVADVSNGQQLNRDNWNLTLGHTWAPASGKLNQLTVQVGGRKYDEPTNSQAVTESFSSGNTLTIGENIVGALLGDSTQWEIRDTFSFTLGSGKKTHDIKMGAAVMHVSDRFDFPVFDAGWLIYATDTRALPLLYIYGEGSGDATIDTNYVSAFVQDDFRASANLTLSFGLRYDLDTNGNNPGFTHPLLSGERKKDVNNFQPRASFSWDATGDGRNVVRGGVGIFTGRFLLVPSFSELQQNGVSGRVVQQRLNGLVLGIPALALNPASPKTTGIPLPKDSTLLDSEYVNPWTWQATLGYTRKLGDSGLYFDLEGIYVKGEDEIIVRDRNFAGNAAVLAGRAARLNPAWNQVNTYTNEGRSEYKAVVASLNGTIKGGHLITASLTLADKKNINDDFSPALTDYPSDPFDIEAEFGRSRADERLRAIVSGVFKLPAAITVAPIVEYGSGQPWNKRLGYDRNGDGKNSDRADGVSKFDQDGPSFFSLSLRLTKRIALGERAGLDLIAEGFNLTNRKNDDVNSVLNGEFLSGPTLTNRAAAFVANPRFGQYTTTLPPFEVQLGVRLTF